MKYWNVLRSMVAGSALLAGLALAGAAHAATIGPGVLDFDQVEIGCQLKGKKSKCVASAVIIGNSGTDSVTQTYEDLFGVEVIEWDRFEQDSGLATNGLIDVEVGVAAGDTLVGENRWFLADPLFDPSSVVGFSFKAGNYSVFFSFIAPGLVSGDEVRFNDFDFYAELLLPEEEFNALGSKLNAGLSNLIVYGVTAVPVPAAFPLAAAGFALWGLMGWCKQRRAA